ncbi:cation-translocating P-type ATPase [Streptomyces zingiberis]|uniref:Cation-transporting P-type ATPase n=1 Tax=Streptomyces zingiberis TaxID=2053010 RepID=A0ABX1BR51_9ACTN|nr:cation-transporting P-type ATPase [Streptomyces zingiberis]NJQ00166.1 cation-transporting P-type ATPase [Streptomyces zingiberis]
MRNRHEARLRPLGLDPEEAAERLLRDLHSSGKGLSTAEARRRLVQYGRNELRRRGGRRWPRELARQFVHPLALLLWVAAALLLIVGSHVVAGAVVLIILLNAGFAFTQEVQAEKAVEALTRYLPQRSRVIRDGEHVDIDAAELVPGDVVVIRQGDRIAADVRLLSGAIEADMSALTGESAPSLRSAAAVEVDVPVLQAHDLVFSGTNCTGGEARGVVFATGMTTELGRIAALSERVEQEPSPMEQQVRRVAWLIAAVSIALAAAFIPVATFGGHLSLLNALVFAAGLLAGMVPEGLLPVITLALAVAVKGLAARGALVKRLSAVETLGSTDVICTDKTGTLTENRMRPTALWTTAGVIGLTGGGTGADTGGETGAAPGEPGKQGPHTGPTAAPDTAPDTAPDGAPGPEPAPEGAPDPAAPVVQAAVRTAAACNNARLQPGEEPSGDPTEVAVLLAARELGADVDAGHRESARRWQLHFDPERKLMSTVDRHGDELTVHTKGAPEAVLRRCATLLDAQGRPAELDDAARERVTARADAFARDGLRVLALARRALPGDGDPPHEREDVERDLCLIGLVAMIDPPRPEVEDAVAHCRSAGIRIIVITGDHPLTAAAVARRVGITGEHPRVVTGADLDELHEHQIGDLLRAEPEIIFARASPEAKLHIADALRGQGHVVAMTGDGVNDAPALHRADIGVAMGRSGTDVAREASTMVLTDDNFASIVEAIRAGRRIYDNVRKFILYIFTHATPEVVPFLVFALGGGAVPLPLTILQLLAFDVGSETLPALALSREKAEPGIMSRGPRPRSEGVIRGPMLIRAWLFLGVIVAALQMAGFFYVLHQAGWHPGDATGAGSPLHHAYQQATTMTFLGMIAGQIGTAFAVRTQRASLRSVGVFSNRYLLAAIGGAIVLAALFVYAPPFQALLGTAAPPASALALLPAYPLIVWGADELRRFLIRRRAARTGREG